MGNFTCQLCRGTSTFFTGRTHNVALLLVSMANIINKIYYFTPTVGIMGRKGTGAANKGAFKPVFILLPLIGTMSCPDNRPATPQTATAQ